LDSVPGAPAPAPHDPADEPVTRHPSEPAAATRASVAGDRSLSGDTLTPMAALLQRQAAARTAARAARAAQRPSQRLSPTSALRTAPDGPTGSQTAASGPLSPVPARADDTAGTGHRGAAWPKRNSSSDDSPGAPAGMRRSDSRSRLRDGVQRLMAPIPVEHRSLPAVSMCGVFSHSERVALKVAAGESTQTGGVIVCASVWSCAVCQARIRAARADELARSAGAWLTSGRGLYLVTLTAPHWGNVLLEDVPAEEAAWRGYTSGRGQLSRMTEGWSRLTAGGWWTGRARQKDGAPIPWSDRWSADPEVMRREITTGYTDDGEPVRQAVVWKRGWRQRHAVAGYTRTIEITSGDNGWHSHIHALVWTEDPASEAAAAVMEGELYDRWATVCRRVGLPTPSPEHGVQVDPIIRGQQQTEAQIRYIAKLDDGFEDPPAGGPAPDVDGARTIAQEMVRADIKLAKAKGQTPFQIATAAVAGDPVARARWGEYCRATKGLRCLTWSQGLRDLLEEILGQQLLPEDDEDLPLDEPAAGDANLWVQSTAYTDAIALRLGGRADLDHSGYVGGLPGAIAFLDSLGLARDVDYGLADPIGDGLPVPAHHIERGREAREAKAARIEAADNIPLSRTPQEWGAAAEQRLTRMAAQRDAAAEQIRDVAVSAHDRVTVAHPPASPSDAGPR
jgi:hypothetical protein